MNRTAILILSAFFLFACQRKKNIPDEVLPPPQMQAVLWDMMRADQFLVSYVFPKDTSLNKKNESVKLYQQIFRIHQIDKKKFRESFSYYEAHPELLKMIMDSIQKKSASAFSGLIPVAEDTITQKLPEDTIVKKDTVPAAIPPRNRIRKVPVN